MLCVECSVVWFRDLDTTAECERTIGSIEMWIWRRMYRKNGRQNKKCSCTRNSGRRKNNAGTDKEGEKKLTGSLAKEELLAE